MSDQQITHELKPITEYIRRAKELTSDETSPKSRLVAYYCRQYAVKIGTPLATDPDSKAALAVIIDAIDAEKDEMEKFTKDEAYAKCRSYAMEVFDQADAEDRVGETVNETSNNLCVAAIYFDVLKQFTEEEGGRGKEVATEEEKKGFYAKRRAAYITKAIEEGRELTPGGYTDDDTDCVVGTDGEEGEEEVQDYPQTNATPFISMREEAGSGEQKIETPPTQVERQMSVRLGRAATFDIPRTDQASAPLGYAATFDNSPTGSPTIDRIYTKSKDELPVFGKIGNGFNKNKVSRDAMKKAKALAKFAKKAFEVKDVDLAIERLKNALEVLTTKEVPQ